MLNNQDEEIKLGIYITECAEFYGESLTESQVIKFISLLEHVFNSDLEHYIKAIDSYMRNGNLKFPTPAQLGKFLSADVSNKDLAINGASKILECIKRFGSWNKEAAQKELGDIVWKAVERFGGWGEVCNLEVSQTHIFLAQMRDTINAMLEMERARDNSIIAIGNSNPDLINDLRISKE